MGRQPEPKLLGAPVEIAVGKDIKEVIEIVKSGLAEMAARRPPPPRPPIRHSSTLGNVWIQTQRHEGISNQLTFETTAAVERSNYVMLFVGDPDRAWPGGLYEVTTTEFFAQNAPEAPRTISCRLVLQLRKPDIATLRELDTEIRSLAGADPQRHTREQRMHGRLVELLWRLHRDTEDGERITAYLGERRIGAVTLRALDVLIHLPERISTAGVLGTTLAGDGELRRFHSHRWAGHAVTITTGDEPWMAGQGAVCVRVTDEPSDTLGPEIVATSFLRTSGNDQPLDKEAFFAACDRAFNSPLPRGTIENQFDLDLRVRRLPKLSPAYAYRRAVQVVVEALAILDAPAHDVPAILHVPGSGALDLVGAQQRVAQSLGGEATLVWIDPETDVAKVRTPASPTDEALEHYQRVGAALGSGLGRDVIVPEMFTDPIIGRFGASAERNGRMLVLGRDPNTLSVQAADERPVRGYVAFYIPVPTSTVQVRCERVRASDGVASVELPQYEQQVAIGIVIEDEGTVLELVITPYREEPAPKRNKKSKA
jgi:hypothetical protein